jgi:protein-L-isoaspartate(D-aspartate) O-methyltransferase
VSSEDFLIDEFLVTPEQMVEEQIITRGIHTPMILKAMRTIPRHRFVPVKYRSLAYTDQPLPIGEEQTISQPYVVAFMTDVLEVEPHFRVLEIGTGSGYQAAVLAELVKEVCTVEIVSVLAERSRELLAELGYHNVYFKVDNGRQGWLEKAPFDRIIVTAASENIPDDLIRQLKPNGKMIIPVGNGFWSQNLVLVTRQKKGFSREKILPVRFVPLVHGKK